MAKSERVEARLSPEERDRIEQAAQFEGESLSSFIVRAAVARADDVLTEHTVTTVPADYFDRLVTALDRPDRAPALRRAASRSRTRSRIA